ncbi:MAG: GyrI-like domain-containing protein, partial [bacterium]|nr:GyrI-like domain-containing protein [bacterium]
TFDYISLPARGSYEKHAAVIEKFWREVADQKITPAGPMLGVYYNNPEETVEDQLIWEIGFPVAAGTKAEIPLVLKKWDFAQVARAIHQGPYETTQNLYPKIFEFMAAANKMEAGPIMERFLDENPENIPSDSLKTEIWIPVANSLQ